MNQHTQPLVDDIADSTGKSLRVPSQPPTLTDVHWLNWLADFVVVLTQAEDAAFGDFHQNPRRRARR